MSALAWGDSYGSDESASSAGTRGCLRKAISGLAVKTYGYDAFGKVISNKGSCSDPFGYAGAFSHQEDATGLKLLGHCFYDPSTGRFLTRDPIKDDRNWYAFGGGLANPVSGADATGLSVLTIPLALKIASYAFAANKAYELEKIDFSLETSLITSQRSTDSHVGRSSALTNTEVPTEESKPLTTI